MINLIPQTAKKKLRVEYWVRVVTVWFLLWSIALLVGALLLLPSYVLIGSQVTAYETSAAEAFEKVANHENTTDGLIAASRQAKMAVDEAEQPVLSSYVTLFEGLQDHTIQLNSIKLSRESNGVGPVILSGLADDRLALSSFRDRLLEEELVETADLPISNLTQDKDIPFNLTVVLVKKTEI